VNGDMKLDIAKFTPPAPPQQQEAAASAAALQTSTSAKLHLESDPPGAHIALDGSFVGNTPSEVQVADGDHTVIVKKNGFKDWHREIKVSAGSSIRLNARLEKTRE